MMRQPRFPLSSVRLICIVLLTVAVAWSVPGRSARGAAAAGGSGDRAESSGSQGPAAVPSKDLLNAVEDFWHYGRIARYDLAVAQGQKVLAFKSQPLVVLHAFQTVAAAHQDQNDIDQWLLRWQGVAAMREVTTQIIGVLDQGHQAQRADLQAIEQNIQRLSTNQRAYDLALSRLRESGELAVPLMVDYLRDSSKSQYQAAIRQALVDMGRPVLNPLVVAAQMHDTDGLISVVSVLGNLGYDAVVPYLAQLANARDTAPAVREAATAAMAKLGVGDPRQLDTAKQFLGLAEKFYYGNSSITYDSRNPMAFVWYWDEQKGLSKRDVPPSIYNDVMTMRTARQALELNEHLGDAVSLWLAADYKREADLPQGATDATRPPNQPDAHYYGVAFGSQYLNAVLERAERDRNAAVALRAIRSLKEIAGSSNLFGQAGTASPVTRALRYPDRLVRFEAAEAVARALPQQRFENQDLVVPILAEAVAQTGRPQVLIVLASQDEVNRLSEGLKDQFAVAGATSADQAVAAARTLPAVDVILTSEDLPDIDRLRALMGQFPELGGATLVVMTRTEASPYVAMAAAVNSGMLATQASEASSLKPVLLEARSRGSSAPLDEAAAMQQALRAADLLARLAISRGQVLDVSAAQQTLLGVVSTDQRMDLVKKAGDVLALINASAVQQGLLSKAVADQTPQDVRIALFKDLATNAKFYGNQLDSSQVAVLQKIVQAEPNLEVRSAAAEARGALNLPAGEAAELLLEQPA